MKPTQGMNGWGGKAKKVGLQGWSSSLSSRALQAKLTNPRKIMQANESNAGKTEMAMKHVFERGMTLRI